MRTTSTNTSTPLSLDHSPVIHTVPGAKIAILMIHGIVSTPRHFDFLLSAIPQECSVHNLLLSGHGGTHRDFAKASMKQWKAQVEDTLLQLEKDHQFVVGIGYSLGCLLLMDASLKHPKLQNLVLLNPPLRPRIGMDMIIRCTRYTFGKVRWEDPVDAATFRDIGCQLKPGPWHYVGWLPRFAELLLLCQKCRKNISQVPASCQAFLGGRDELVRLKTKKDLARNALMQYEIAQDCSHCYYTEEFQQSVITCISKLLEDLLQ